MITMDFDYPSEHKPFELLVKVPPMDKEKGLELKLIIESFIKRDNTLMANGALHAGKWILVPTSLYTHLTSNA